MCNSLWPHWLQHARLSCPSLSPGVCSNSCPLSQWCYLISYPLLPSSPFAFGLSQYQSLFQWAGSSRQLAKVVELQFQHQSFQWIFRVDFLWDWLVWSSCCPKDSQESSPAPQFKSTNSLVFILLCVQLSHPYMTTGKTIALTIWTFVGKMMSLLFNTPDSS